MSAVRSGTTEIPDNEWHALIAEWLSGLFMAPLSPNSIASYRDGLGATFLDLFAKVLGCEVGAQRMRFALVADASPVAVARNLAHAFTLLFEGAGGVSSRETSPGAFGREYPSPVSQMEELLRDAGLSPTGTSREPSDHLPAELALLAQMMRRGVGNQAQRVLLDDHLLVWAPAFAGRCHAADHSGFYAGAAQVLTGFLVTRSAALQTNNTVMRMPVIPRAAFTSDRSA